MKESKLYCCYSIPLRNFLITNGEKYELCANNPNNQKTMWIFVKTENLNRLLKQWTENRPD